MFKSNSLINNILIVFIYISIATFHIMLSYNSLILVMLICIYELTRILAYIVNARLVVIFLSIISMVFISSNYHNIYYAKKQNRTQANELFNNINKYNNRYWQNQQNHQNDIKTQLSILKANKKTYMPIPIIIYSLIISIECSLAFIINTKNKNIIQSKQNGYYKRLDHNSKALYFNPKGVQISRQAFNKGVNKT